LRKIALNQTGQISFLAYSTTVFLGYARLVDQNQLITSDVPYARSGSHSWDSEFTSSIIYTDGAFNQQMDWGRLSTSSAVAVKKEKIK